MILKTVVQVGRPLPFRERRNATQYERKSRPLVGRPKENSSGTHAGRCEGERTMYKTAKTRPARFAVIAVLAFCILANFTMAETVTYDRETVLNSLAENVHYLPMGYVPPEFRNSTTGMGGWGTSGDTPEDLLGDPEVQAILEGLRAKLREAGREILPDTVSISSPTRAEYYLNKPYKTQFDNAEFNDFAIRVFFREWVQGLEFEKCVPAMTQQEKNVVAASVNETLDAMETVTKQHLNLYFPGERIGKEFDSLRDLARTMMEREAPPTTAFRKPIDAEARARVTAEYEKRLQDSLGTIDAHLASKSENREAPENVPDRFAGTAILKRLNSRLLKMLAHNTTDSSILVPEPDPALREASSKRNEMQFRLMADYQMNQPKAF